MTTKIIGIAVKFPSTDQVFSLTHPGSCHADLIYDTIEDEEDKDNKHTLRKDFTKDRVVSGFIDTNDNFLSRQVAGELLTGEPYPLKSYQFWDILKKSN